MVRCAIAALAAVTVVAAFLPWASMSLFGTKFSVQGIDEGANGWITLIAGVIIGGVVGVSAVKQRQAPLRMISGVVSVIGGAAITMVSIVDMSDLLSDDFGLIELESGLILTLISGVAITVLGGIALVLRR